MILKEYDLPWMDKKVPNPNYGKVPRAHKMIKVGSLPKEQQARYAPPDFDFKTLDKTTKPKINYTKEITKDLEQNGRIEYRQDFYILVPNSFDSVIEYAKSNRLVPGIIDGSEVTKYHKDQFVIKIRSLPVDAVESFFDNKKNHFVYLADMSAKEINSFINTNVYDNIIYGLNIKDYIHADGVSVVNDSPTELKTENIQTGEKRKMKSKQFVFNRKPVNESHDDAGIRNRPKAIFDNTHPKVNDDRDHFPIDTIERARNALARANQYDKVPEWYDGDIDSFLGAVVRGVHKAYPSINIDVEKDTTLEQTEHTPMETVFHATERWFD